jgi:hypothetical protein
MLNFRYKSIVYVSMLKIVNIDKTLIYKIILYIIDFT